jgi:uncharacterized protein with PIN domain
VILDSSAVISVLLREHGREGLETKMREATWLGIGAPTLVETRSVMVRRHGMAGLEEADRFLAGLDMAVIPFDARHADVARRIGPLRQGPPPGEAELRGLHDLCDGAGRGRAAALHW